MAASSNLTSLQFQFTHPGKGATVTRTQTHIISCVSIHAPWEGCDLSLTLNTLPKVCFNSRTLGRVRLSTSIFRTCLGSFNSRTLGRVRLSVTGGITKHNSFNSRTLGRVRHGLQRHNFYIDKVSIHAPWEGCDRLADRHYHTTKTFQFTHPGKGATLPEMLAVVDTMFQFTHPGKGATHGAELYVQERTVSIHAPWEGCDPHYDEQ